MGSERNPVLWAQWRRALNIRRLQRSDLFQALVAMGVVSLLPWCIISLSGARVLATMLQHSPLWIGLVLSVWIALISMSTARDLREGEWMAPLLVAPVSGGQILWGVLLPPMVIHLALWTAVNTVLLLWEMSLLGGGFFGVLYFVEIFQFYTGGVCLGFIPLGFVFALRLALRFRGEQMGFWLGTLLITLLYLTLLVGFIGGGAWMWGLTEADEMILIWPFLMMSVCWGLFWLLMRWTGKGFHALAGVK